MKEKRKSLHIDLYSDDVYSSFGTDNIPLLNDEISHTIQTYANNSRAKTKLTINFKTYEEDPIDYSEFLDAYKNTFKSKINEKKFDLKRQLILGTSLFIIGLILLLIDVRIESKVSNYFYELINIFAWVFCWVAIEVLTLEMTKIVIEIQKLNKLINAKITFTCENIQSIAETNKKIAQKVAKKQKANAEIKKQI